MIFNQAYTGQLNSDNNEHAYASQLNSNNNEHAYAGQIKWVEGGPQRLPEGQ
jgi:hypothetical protein